MSDKLLSYDIPGILETQRNRHPLLFIDNAYDVQPGVSAYAKKCYSYNEWFFPSHFDDEPNVPGFIQVESLVQTFLMTFLTLEGMAGKKTNFLKINNVNFKRKVIPGDVTIIKSELVKFKRGIASGHAKSYVGDDLACSAEFLVAVPDILDGFKPSS
jgi:3-hydroxyacyl-[acyl-carrier-protein] dehydratase